jgi:hypothetical protein
MTKRNMTDKKKIIFVTIATVVLAAASAVIFSICSKESNLALAAASLPTNGPVFASVVPAAPETVTPPALPKPKFVLPNGKQTFQVNQAVGVWPKIIQATIDPPDVHVGNVQKLSVVVESPVGIASVVAEIQTDHKTITVPLELVGPTPTAEILPAKYYINGDNKLAFAGGGAPVAEKSGAHVAEAAEPPALTYAANWTVEDTHNITYHTTFVVKDNAGKTNSITLAWSDACGIPASGNWTMSGSCSLTSDDGPASGNLYITAGTLTLNSGVTLHFNPGYSVQITSGAAIVVASGAKIYKDPSWTGICTPTIWYYDADGDGYGTSGNTYYSCAWPGTGWTNVAGDCCDSDPYAHPGQTNWIAFPDACGNYDVNCDGYQTLAYNPWGCVEHDSEIECEMFVGYPAPCHFAYGITYHTGAPGPNPPYDCGTCGFAYYNPPQGNGPGGCAGVFPGSGSPFCQICQ